MTDLPSTLTELISPMNEEEFFVLLRRREFAYRPTSGGVRPAPRLGWRALRGMLEAGEYPKRRNDVRVVRESNFIARERWTTDGKVDAVKLDEFLANGFSVVVNHIEDKVPALESLCEDIRARLLEGATVAAVVTSRTARGAFKVHFDPEDLVILQVEGTKRWQIFGPAVSNPLQGMAEQPPPDPKPLFDEVLEPGDLLFVPGGNWHHCESGLSTSVHLGIFFMPPTAWHAVNDLMKLMLRDELFRTPLTRLGDPSELAAMEAEVRERLIETMATGKLSEFIAGWHKIAY
jgi:ribosomal protein L16 Arg81 hydroxylase